MQKHTPYNYISGQISHFLRRVPVWSDKQLISGHKNARLPHVLGTLCSPGLLTFTEWGENKYHTASSESCRICASHDAQEYNLTHNWLAKSFIFLRTRYQSEGPKIAAAGCVIACRATIYRGASRPCVAGTLIRISLNALIVCFRGRAAGGRRGHRVAQRRRRPPALRRLQLLGRAADADAVDGLGRSRLHPQPPPVPRLQDAAIPHGQYIYVYKRICA
jgi:hypothetical protein